MPPTAFPSSTRALTARNWPSRPTASSATLSAAIYGPGTVAMAAQGIHRFYLVFNKVGQLLFNFGPTTIDEATATPNFLWGSFDGTTNLPSFILSAPASPISSARSSSRPSRRPSRSARSASPMPSLMSIAASGLSLYQRLLRRRRPGPLHLLPGHWLHPAVPACPLPANGVLSGTPYRPGLLCLHHPNDRRRPAVHQYRPIPSHVRTHLIL